jgi:nucleoside-diphosphate-sugar epimerase
VKILVTGGTGQVLGPATQALARDHEVWCLGRFGDTAARAELETLGIRTHRWEIGTPIDGLPSDFTHVVHSAWLREDHDFDVAIGANCAGVATLMTHCRQAEAFVLVSTFGVYQRLAPDHLHAETDPLRGDTPWRPAYGASKIAAEGTARALAQVLGLPTTIARMNCACGPMGWGGIPVYYCKLLLDGEPIPVPPGGGYMSLIHTDDVARQLPLLWAAASVPATVVNWAGDETTTALEVLEHLERLTGRHGRTVEEPVARGPFASDNSRRRGLIGGCEVDWRTAVTRAVSAHFPTAVQTVVRQS